MGRSRAGQVVCSDPATADRQGQFRIAEIVGRAGLGDRNGAAAWPRIASLNDRAEPARPVDHGGPHEILRSGKKATNSKNAAIFQLHDRRELILYGGNGRLGDRAIIIIGKNGRAERDTMRSSDAEPL